MPLLRNIHPPKEVVQFWALAIYIPYAVLFSSYFFVSTVFDQPYSFLAECCSRSEHRNLDGWRLIILAVPGCLSVASFCMDILLIRFLRKTILPSKTPPPNIPSVTTTGETFENSTNNDAIHQQPTETRESQTCKCFIKDWISDLIKIEGPEKIPIRVSILSSGLMIPNIIANVFIGMFGLSFEQRTYFLWIILAIANTVRCPLTVVMAFKTNSKSTESRKKEMTERIIGEMNLQNGGREDTGSVSDTFW